MLVVKVVLFPLRFPITTNLSYLASRALFGWA